MKKDKSDKDPRHPIGVVSRRTGIAQDLIRAWERRYGVVTPSRTDTGRRLYSDADVKRLRLLKQLVDGGRRISDVAAMKLAELESLAAEDRQASDVAPTPARPLASDREVVEAAIEAARRLDRAGLERTLAEAALSMSAPEMRQRLLTPLLEEIGERWREGTVRVAHEHLASTIVRTFIESLRGRSTNGGNRPKIIVATPTGQQHELGALMAATAAEEVGWEVVYLGANLPAEEIGGAARRIGVRAVGVSIVYGADAHAADELRSIRQYLDSNIELIVGGRGAKNLDGVIQEIGAHRAGDLQDFQSTLGVIEKSPPAE